MCITHTLLMKSVEAGDTDKDLLRLTALCCVPVTVQVAMLLNVSVANHIQSFDQVGICLIEMLIGFVTQSPACLEFSIMDVKLLEIYFFLLVLKNGLSQSLDVGQECDDTTSDLESDQSHFEM